MMDNIQIRMFAQRLADNVKPIRDKALKMLRKNFKISSTLGDDFELDDMLNIWKGLFYSMYMSDKSLTQEALAEDISNLIHELQKNADKRCFIQAALHTFAREWIGIDVFRTDKMMMFVRRILRQSFEYLKRLGWNIDESVHVMKLFEEHVICPDDNTNGKPLGLKLHLCDIYLEELSKIGGENLDHKIILLFLQPYIKVLALSNQKVYVERVTERVIRHLIRQSDLGIAEGEGLVEGDFIPVEDDSDLEDEEVNSESQIEEPMEHDGAEESLEESVLDPRAGAVDVCLPQLNVDYEKLAEDLQAMGSVAHINQRKRNLLYEFAKQFKDLAAGIYPLGVPEHILQKSCSLQKEKEKGLHRLQKYEKKLTKKYDIGKKRKHQNATSVGSKSAGDSMDVDLEQDDQVLSSLSAPQPIKKKFKNKNKKNVKKENKEKVKPKEYKKKMLLKKSIDDKLKMIQDKAGIQSSQVTVKPQKSRKRKSMEFEVSDLTDIPVTTPNKKTKLSPNKISKSPKSPVLNISNSLEVKKNDNVGKKTLKASTGENSSQPQNIVLNVSSEKKAQLGLVPTQFSSGWDEPLKEGEIEYTVKSRKQILKDMKVNKKEKKNKKVKKNIGNNGNRSLIFNLSENKEHPFSDYTKSIRSSPSIPFSANKRPKASVLKPSPSPILISKPLLKTLNKTFASSASPKLKKLKRLNMSASVL